MATEPSDLPLWSTDEDPVSNAAPSAGKIAAGFDNQEQPPRQDHNFLFNLIGKWTDFHKQQENLSTTNINDVITAGGFDPVTDPDKLLDALNIIIDKEGVWVDATKHGLVTGSPPAGTNKDALNAAFAVSPFVFMPPGTYELDTVSGDVTPPDGAILAGAGVSTVIKFTSSGTKFTLDDIDTTFRNFKIDSNALSTKAFDPAHTVEAVTNILGIQFTNWGTGAAGASRGITTSGGTDKIGLVNIIGCAFSGFSGTSVSISAGNVGDTTSSRVNCENCLFMDTPPEFIGITKALRRFHNNEIFNGDLAVEQGFNLIFTDNEMDLDGWFFTASEGPKFINNHLPGTLANAFTFTTAFVNWRDNKDIDGLIQTHAENINGGSFDARAALQAVPVAGPPGTYQVITWTLNQVSRISNDLLYTKDTLYTGSNEFQVFGLGDGHVTIRVEFTTTGLTPTSERAAIFINGTLFHRLSQSLGSSNEQYYSFNGQIEANVGDLIDIRILNNSAAAFNVLSLGIDNLVSFVQVEGL